MRMEFDSSTRLLVCAKCGGSTTHGPVEASSHYIAELKRSIASHWKCGVCGTERHYGFAITECHLCPMELKDQVVSLMRSRFATHVMATLFLIGFALLALGMTG